MSKDADDTLKLIGLGGCAASMILLIALLGVVVDGFVLSHLWSWFVVPRFGVAALTATQAWGLAAFLRYARPVATDKVPDDKDERLIWLKDALIEGLITRPGITLATSYIVFHFVMS